MENGGQRAPCLDIHYVHESQPQEAQVSAQQAQPLEH